MHICRRFRFLICAGLLAAVALSGCGGSSTNETVPTTVSIFSSHSIIFRNNTAMTMGYNAFGQLGNGTTDNTSVAAIVPTLGHMDGGAAGIAHTLAFSNHTSVVWAWGYNGYGQLGNPGISTSAGLAFSATPVTTPSLSGTVTDVAAGGYHSLAVAGDRLYSWGDNRRFGVGDGTADNRNAPVQLVKDRYDNDLPAKALKVAAGGLHSLALFEAGDQTRSVYAWGDNTFGQLGFTHFSTVSRKPRKVSLPTVGRVEQIAAGNKFSLALEVVRDGGGAITGQTLWGWGFGAVGQLGKDPATLSMLTAGNTNTAYSENPVEIVTVSGVGPTTEVIKKISVGLDHVLLLFGPRDSDADGKIQAFGFNFYGQLGNNMGLSPTDKETSTSSFELVYVLNTSGAAGSQLTGVTDIAAFGDHSLGKAGGVWYGWGNNNMGQLGKTPPLSSAGNPKFPETVQGF